MLSTMYFRGYGHVQIQTAIAREVQPLTLKSGNTAWFMESRDNTAIAGLPSTNSALAMTAIPPSLETMGLVRTTYPKLDAVVRVPDFPPGLPAFSLSDWKDFLKIVLDFHIRENTFIDLPDSWRKWGGNRLSAKQLLPPDSKELQTNKLKRWPQSNPAGRQSRLVRLLAYVCKLDAESSYGKEIIDCILRSAWDQLIAVGLLQPGGIGRYLTLNDVALAPIEKAWVCPVTRRILDVTFRGVTPYLPEKAVSPSVADCRAVTIPRCDLVLQDFPSDDQRIDVIRDWVNGNESVDQLRRDGLWSDLNDRILEGGTYFRTAEHSAQQPGARLAEYESQFKTGKINLLSCSTTMEMGVDIGGISVVAMNNVPPHPANYLQRAGRAGRRGETRSVSLALCKNNPHDQNVFSNTLWAFNTELPAPAVLLSSSILIQRHINSMLLAAFLRKELSGSGSAEKLSLEWWMLPKDSARLQRFCAWACCFDPIKEPHLAQGLRSLLRHTPHEGTASLDRLAQEAARMAGEHAVSWYAEFDAIEGELDRFPISDANTSPAFKALTIQKKRLTAEYLLRELATEGFLPGYGFPTDISSFETLTCDELERNKHRRIRSPDEPGRIDNRMRFRDLPSRDTVTALREYAPGSEVVIDGLVYRSAGITLNWHAPASVTDITEIQNIREAWRCRNCGSSGTMPSNKIWHNWPHPDARDRAVEAAFEFSGIQANVTSRSKQDAIHARRLDFTLDTGDTVQIWFDQGCSYWQIPRSNPNTGRSWFPFDKSAEVQGEAIALADARVEGQAFPTYVFVGR